MLLPLFAVLIVGTVFAMAYYGFFTATLNVQQSISVNGNLEQDLGTVFDLESVDGSPIEITNNAPSERNIIVSDNSGEDVSVTYMSSLGLAQKDVDFDISIWELAEDGQTAVIEYVVVGDEFSAEVVEGELEGYALYYYKDNSDRFDSPAEAILLSEVSENLPFEDDANIDENDYSEEYGVAHGAKIWYLPITAVTDGDIDWSRASEFLFETTLIQYNAEGELVLSSGQTIELTPVYTPSAYVEGEKVITTEIL